MSDRHTECGMSEEAGGLYGFFRLYIVGGVVVRESVMYGKRDFLMIDPGIAKLVKRQFGKEVEKRR